MTLHGSDLEAAESAYRVFKAWWDTLSDLYRVAGRGPRGEGTTTIVLREIAHAEVVDVVMSVLADYPVLADSRGSIAREIAGLLTA